MKKVCKYCHFLPNGDFADDRKDLLHQKIKVPTELKFEHGSLKIKNEIEYYLCVGQSSKSYKLALLIFNNDNDELLTDASINIKYCPVCGRKLLKGDN